MCITYGERGKPKEYSEYSNNELNGKYIKMHSNGKPHLYQNFKNGTPHGWAATFTYQGKMIVKKKFENGEEVELNEVHT